MWPTLISIGPIDIHSFGVLLFLGFFLGAFKLWQKAKEAGWEESAVMDGWLIAGAGAVITGRLGYILFYPEVFGGSWYKMIFLTKFPGLSAETAWLGGLIILLVWGFKQKLNFWTWFEAVVAAVLLVEIMAHLGSLLAGADRLAETIRVAGLVLVYGLLNFWEKRYRTLNLKEGVLAAAYLILTGVLSFGLGWRQSQPYQWWGVGLAVAGGLILWFRSGITIKAPVKKLPSRKKRGFDYV